MGVRELVRVKSRNGFITEDDLIGNMTSNQGPRLVLPVEKNNL